MIIFSVNSVRLLRSSSPIIATSPNGLLVAEMQMVDTRRTVGASGASGSGGHTEDNHEAPPPPPPPYTADQFFAQFLNSQRNIEAALRHIAGTPRGMGGLGGPQHSSFKDFTDTKPPIFKEAAEPLEADEWINTIE